MCKYLEIVQGVPSKGFSKAIHFYWHLKIYHFTLISTRAITCATIAVG